MFNKAGLRVIDQKFIKVYTYRSPVRKFSIVQSFLDVGVYQLIETMCPQLLRENRDWRLCGTNTADSSTEDSIGCDQVRGVS